MTNNTQEFLTQVIDIKLSDGSTRGEIGAILDGSGLGYWHNKHKNTYQPTHLDSGLALMGEYRSKEYTQQWLGAIAPLTDWTRSAESLLADPTWLTIRSQCEVLALDLRFKDLETLGNSNG